MKKEKGITLVALVVTIIVLIILAGISINLILGNNGIITISKKAKENIELARVEEETQLNELYTQLETGGSSSGDLPYDSIAKLTEFKTAIANAIDEAGGIKPDITAETSVFADNIKGILKEVTKDATATADKILKDYKAYSQGKLLTGTMENYAGQTVTASTITENGDNVEITIPAAGYYGADSKVNIPTENIKNSTNGYKGYIFKNGEFVNNSFVTNGFNGSSGLAEINNNYLEIKGIGNGGTGRRQYLILQTAIDLTNIDEIFIELKESRAYGSFRILFSTTKPTSYSADPTTKNLRYASYNTEKVNTTYSFNTSNLSGDNYMTIYVDGSSVVSDYFDIFIKTIAYK